MEIISKESLDMVFSQLDKVANKLGVGADYFWPLLVKQQYIDAVWSSLVFGISLICFGILSFFMTKHWRPKKEKGIYSIYGNDHEGPWIAGLLIFGIAVAISGVAFLCVFPEIFNAEYWALKDLIRMIK